MAAKRKKSLGVKLLSFILCVGLLAGIIYLAIDISKEVKTTFSLQAEVKEAEAERNRLLKEKNLLIDKKEKLENEDYIIAYARGGYLLTREGEQIFKLPKIVDSEE